MISEDIVDSKSFNFIHSFSYFLITAYLLYFFVRKIINDERKSREVLKESENRFDAIKNTSKDGIIFIDEDNKIIDWNKGAEKIFGYKENEVKNKNIFGKIFNQVESNIILNLLKNKDFEKKLSLNPVIKKGLSICCDVSFHVLYKNKKRYFGIIVTDKTKQIQIDKKHKLWTKVFQNSSENILIMDSDKKIITANRSFFEQTGFLMADVLNMDLNKVIEFKKNKSLYENIKGSLIEKGEWAGETLSVKSNGDSYPVWINLSVINDESDNYPEFFVVNFTDITEYKNTKEALDNASRFDSLTKLPDKRTLFSNLEKTLSIAKERKKQVAYISLDLDHFQQINDSYSPSIGDLLIKDVANRLRESVRKSDILIHSYGDEFVIIHSYYPEKEDLDEYVNKIKDKLKGEFDIAGNEFLVTASFGISIFPKDGRNAVEIFKNGDAAMHSAKFSGRDTICYYDQKMTEMAKNKLFIKTHLKSAIENGRDEFQIHYQPQYKINKDTVPMLTGFESLIRWKHPEKGFISPADFIPISEDAGLIVPVGYMIINKVFSNIKNWKENGYDVPKVSINVSPRQLQDSNFINYISMLLEDYEIDPTLIEFEITETFIMNDPENSIDVLNEINKMGITISIDDFGTGYSSLSYLKKLPINKLKIDQSFIKDIPNDNDDASIVKSIVNLAQNMGLETIAEGVETKDQESFLIENECYNVQGYLYSKPIKEENVLNLLKRR
jgi:diguanylate cyclase (GGDEF)-like protein/PAS domain S-box-containing protein